MLLSRPCPEPYRILFPLALACGWLGASYWLRPVGLEPYLGLRHALVLTQAMLIAFAYGFLFTAVPPRTGTAPVGAWQVGLAMLLVAAIAGLIHWQHLVLAQLTYGLAMMHLLAFSVSRTADPQAARRAPNAFVVLPIAMASGVFGAVLIAVSLRGHGSLTGYVVGRELVQQGVFTLLIVGVGALILPLALGHRPPVDADDSRGHRLRRLGFVALALAIVASYVVEAYVSWLGLGGRAALIAGALVACGAARRPRKPGAHRYLILVSAWMLPVGLALAALDPGDAVAALHVSLIGGIALLAFAVAAHVSLDHGDRETLMVRWSVRAVAMGALFLAALGLRLGAQLVPLQYYELLAVGSAVWLAATFMWAALVGASLLSRVRSVSSLERPGAR